jgi:hypothetical protein
VPTGTPRLDWPAIVQESARIVNSYSTGVTLRQLFYRLVSAHILPNSQNAYKGLSRYTARARREGWFPDFIDRNRSIHRYRTFDSPNDAANWLKAIYRRPRDEGQEWSIYLGVEKSGIVEQLTAWFADYGIGIVALGGYASQSYVDQIAREVDSQGRPAVFIYAGDFDPSGEDIERDFLERSGCWTEQHRIALTPAQIQQYNLPPLPGKSWDSRAAGFIERHGQLMQVELDALDPNDLHNLYTQAFETYWDDDVYQQSIAREEREEAQLKTGDIVLSIAQAEHIHTLAKQVDQDSRTPSEYGALLALSKYISDFEDSQADAGEDYPEDDDA